MATSRSSRGRRVVVIGAGMSGLTAIDRLARAGFAVTVLEAGPCAGGRVRTARVGFADGLYADLGATYIIDCHPHVLAYAARFDLPLQIVNPRHLPSMFHLRGRNYPLRLTSPIDWPVALTPAERKLGYLGMLGTYLAPGLQTIGDPSQPGWPDAPAAKLDRIDGGELLRRAGASNAAIGLLDSGLLDVYGDGLRTTSALFLLAQQKLTAYRTAYTVPGGMDQLPRALAQLYCDRIAYGREVTAIERHARGVRVRVRRAGGVETIDADFAIAALPYAALRRIPITPALSPDKARVVARQGTTSVVRAFVQCRERFWEAEDPSGNVFTDIPGLSIFSGYKRPGRRGLLEGYFVGRPARRLAAMSPAARARAVVTAMARVFPGLPRETETAVVQVWDQDRWARGAYAWYRPGEFVPRLPQLAAPQGRLHFAGDHTSLMPGWMEGAITSGLRAADEIARRA